MTVRCVSCNHAIAFSSGAVLEKPEAVEQVDDTHTQARVWLIDHAKTCAGDAEQRPDDRGNWTRSHVGSTDHKPGCAFFRTVKIDPGGNAVGDCDCGAV